VVLSQQVLDEKPANPVDVLETALLNKKAAGGAGNTEVVGPAAVSSIQQLMLAWYACAVASAYPVLWNTKADFSASLLMQSIADTARTVAATKLFG